ncbi:uncharacterized protein F5Z01DRAFT_105339 [Emericellopsis atlantica]|uniref:Cyclin-like domain-containing protein n=1 Tax=Emericellopsis atlantica TaxID=2614577 RepID=A0A9P8CPS7_9HYPO|nr:uncharacterized protein F5Z01DRAFT_105339 [Emericellopsis atlantica]KAG9254430.1 hypothetical protein F5Z01DRAFT_105339 [Emericellopsis atlantica]
MSSLRKPSASKDGPKPRFAGARPHNPARALRERSAQASSRNASVSFAPSTKPAAAAPLVSSSRQQCPNKACPKPNVVDGTCRTCGRIADESNIVAEVQFGETSSGAAMVQGSFIGADQAGVRSSGPAFRRVGGTEDREKSIREARGLMQGYAQQLNVSESLVTSGTQVFKLASSANFVQGRTIMSVAAVCLYAACRAEPPCKLMLIDLADLVQMNVFKLGRIFKKLNEVVPIGNDGMIPVYPEDLIWRFATKMEFHQDTAKVAEDAVRLVKRMSRDWMVMGRRPSGICGACLLMAARMHNFRRTVREVVYIVKVTNHTIQNRLSEFKVTESSEMTVEDFLKQDFLESAHDPPSFYRRTEEHQRLLEEKGLKRKRPAGEEGPFRRRESVAGGADMSKAPAVEYRRDADGFVVPFKPSEIPRDEQKDAAAEKEIENLVQEFGDEMDEQEQADGRKKKSQLPINEEWEEDEQELEDQIEEIFNDPLTQQHALVYNPAEQRARMHSHWALQQRPLKEISMSAEVQEDEFANDPEVMNCLLSPEEARIKETIWVNQNKEWLRQHQEKVFRRKVEADKPKQTRKRKKQKRMGEGQTSPASSAAEAAIGVAKDRAWSKRINYDAIRSMFDSGPDGGLGSEATSRKTSVAGSVLGEPLEPVADQAENEEPEAEDEEYPEYDETADYDGEEFGGGREYEGGFDEDDPGMDEEYGLEGDEYT